MNEWVGLWVSLMAWVLLAALPAMAVFTIASWRLARRYWPYRIPVVIAIVNTIVGACSTWLAIDHFYYSTVGPPPDWFAVLTATSVVAQSMIVFLNTALLVYLDRQQSPPSPPSQHRRAGENGHLW